MCATFATLLQVERNKLQKDGFFFINIFLHTDLVVFSYSTTHVKHIVVIHSWLNSPIYHNFNHSLYCFRWRWKWINYASNDPLCYGHNVKQFPEFFPGYYNISHRNNGLILRSKDTMPTSNWGRCKRLFSHEKSQWITRIYLEAILRGAWWRR